MRGARSKWEDNMATFSLSKAATQRAIQYTKEAHELLTGTARVMDDQVNRRFIGLKDPAYISYLELSVQMQDLLGQVAQKMESICEHCEKVDRWIDSYNER